MASSKDSRFLTGIISDAGQGACSAAMKLAQKRGLTTSGWCAPWMDVDSMNKYGLRVRHAQKKTAAQKKRDEETGKDSSHYQAFIGRTIANIKQSDAVLVFNINNERTLQCATGYALTTANESGGVWEPMIKATPTKKHFFVQHAPFPVFVVHERSKKARNALIKFLTKNQAASLCVIGSRDDDEKRIARFLKPVFKSCMLQTD